MGRTKRKLSFSDIYKGKTRGISLENKLLLRFVMESLPEETKEKIIKFRSFLKAKRIANKDKSQVDLVENDPSLSKEIDRLINTICRQTGLSKKLYEHYVGWYILYDRYKGPPVNFLIKPTKNSVIIELFRRPKTDDWDIIKPHVEYEFDKMPNIFNVRIDPRNEKTYERKLKASQAKTGYDAIDEIYGENRFNGKEEKQKLKLVHQDRKRRNKLKEKVNSS